MCAMLRSQRARRLLGSSFSTRSSTPIAPCRAVAARVHALALDRQQAGIAVVAEDAVLLLAPAHQRGRLQHQQVDLGEDGLDGAERA